MTRAEIRDYAARVLAILLAGVALAFALEPWVEIDWWRGALLVWALRIVRARWEE